MVLLTENLVLSKSRTDSLAHVKNLNVWGNEISDVSVLQRMPNVEVLSLSVNKIYSLYDFQFCTKLKELYLRKNEVKDIREVKALQNLSNLRILWLSGAYHSELINYCR